MSNAPRESSTTAQVLSKFAMSRASQRNGVPRGPGEEDGELHTQLHTLRLSTPPSQASANAASASPDICPVCKSSRYLNPNMRFLVNPECYHKMCESCVDRIFSQGPAPCPVAGCGRTLRKQRFRKQTFGDIHIEREVDIRRRVAQVYASSPPYRTPPDLLCTASTAGRKNLPLC